MEEIEEIEIDEDEIYAYLFDEDDNEIGFVIKDDNGNEQEYYYAEGHEENLSDDSQLLIDTEKVKETTSDLNEIYTDSAQVIHELKDTLKDIQDSFSIFKK